MQTYKRLFLVTLAFVMALGFVMIPTGQAAAASGTCTQTHTVQTGENLFRIGLRYGVSWTVLAQWNHLPNPNIIYVGQVLCVNGPATTGPGSPGVPDTTVGTAVYPGNPFGPTTDPRVIFPVIYLHQSFELRGYNFPPNTLVTISMTTLGSRPYIPYYTATTDAGGTFYVSVTIPDVLVNAGTVAVDVRTVNGYYARNWFYNY